MRPIEEYSNPELLEVIRRAENTDIPGSLYQRAYNEWQLRQQQRLIDATNNRRSGVFLEVGGDMTNHGVIQTDSDSDIKIAVAGNYSSNEKAKLIRGPRISQKEWYEKPLGQILLAVIAGLIIAGVAFYLHWN